MKYVLSFIIAVVLGVIGTTQVIAHWQELCAFYPPLQKIKEVKLPPRTNIEASVVGDNCVSNNITVNHNSYQWTNVVKEVVTNVVVVEKPIQQDYKAPSATPAPSEYQYPSRPYAKVYLAPHWYRHTLKHVIPPNQTVIFMIPEGWTIGISEEIPPSYYERINIETGQVIPDYTHNLTGYLCYKNLTDQPLLVTFKCW